MDTALRKLKSYLKQLYGLHYVMPDLNMNLMSHHFTVMLPI
jgi:hypothetical protein